MTSSDEFELDEIVPGSIIQRKLKSAWIPLAKHIGIYVSDEQVIHFSGEHVFRSDFAVCAETLEEFADGRPITVRDCAIDDDHSAAVIAEAQRLLYESENGFNGSYHFVRKNCEDFAAQCYEVEFPTARDLNIMRSEKASTSQRSSVVRFAKKAGKVSVGVVGCILVVGAGSMLVSANRQDQRSSG